MAIEKVDETGEDTELSESEAARLEYEELALVDEESEFEKMANSSTEENDEELPEGDKPEDSSDDETAVDWEKRSKDTQSEFTKSQQRNSNLETELGDLKDVISRVDRLGGVENIEKYLRVLETDEDFVKLLNQKRDSKNLGISEEGLTPEAKEVLSLVRKVAKREAEKTVEIARGEIG